MKWIKINESTTEETPISIEWFNDWVEQEMWTILDKLNVSLTKSGEEKLFSYIMRNTFKDNFANDAECSEWLARNYDLTSYEELCRRSCCFGDYSYESSLIYDDVCDWLVSMEEGYAMD